MTRTPALAATILLALATPAAAQPCGDIDGDGAVTSADVQGLKWIVRQLAYPWLSLPAWLDSDADGAADGCAVAVACGVGTTLGPDGSTCQVDLDSAVVQSVVDDAYADGLAAGTGTCSVQADEPTAWFSELRVDQPGLDADEYIELAAAPDASLDGLTLLVLGDAAGSGSGSGVIEVVIDLDGLVVGDSGLLVIAESTFSLGAADLTLDLNLENSDNLTFFLVEGFDGELGDDLDADDDGTLDAPPWDTEHARVALVEEDNPPTFTELHYGPPSAGPGGAPGPGHAWLCGDVWLVGAFDPDDLGASDSPGEVNCEEATP